jgi:hypothetical protein
MANSLRCGDVDARSLYLHSPTGATKEGYAITKFVSYTMLWNKLLYLPLLYISISEVNLKKTLKYRYFAHF